MDQLEERFALTNGSRKYKLNKNLYETKQEEKPISEYYTQMRVLWEELESLNTPITTVNTEITTFICELNKHKEEQRLFLFLNGMKTDYSAQRSQILMMSLWRLLVVTLSKNKLREKCLEE